METPLPFHYSEVPSAIQDQDLRIMKIVAFALAAGVSLFVVIILFLHTNLPSSETQGDARFVTILTTVALTYAAIIFNIARFFYKSGFKKQLPSFFESAAADKTDPIQSALVRYRRLWLIRMAMMEGAALLGAVTCMVAHFNGLLTRQPLYWINLAPAVLFIGIVIRQFPSKKNITAYFKEMTQP